MKRAEIDAKNNLFRRQRMSEMHESMEELHNEIEVMKQRLAKGREYLMGVQPSNLTVEDALEAFGFGRNGLW